MHNNEEGINRHITPNMWIFIKLAVLTFCTLLFKLYGGGDDDVLSKNNTTIQDGVEISNDNISIKNLTKIDVEVVRKVIIRQPNCPKSYMLVILEEICMDLVIKRTCCMPEDVDNLSMHKIPAYYTSKSRSSNENQGNAVNYIVGGLLVTSLSAALVELYKAKFQHPKEDKKTKTPLSQKCSLADLTVLKHHRKELVRRESILEFPEEGGGGSKQQLQGFRPPPLHRRCSFPVGPVSCGSRSASGLPGITSNFCRDDRRTSIDHSIRRPSMFDSRRTSIILDSRRPSVVIESRRTSFIADSSCRTAVIGDSRRLSINEEFVTEKRHHSRLVHRH